MNSWITDGIENIQVQSGNELQRIYEEWHSGAVVSGGASKQAGLRIKCARWLGHSVDFACSVNDCVGPTCESECVALLYASPLQRTSNLFTVNWDHLQPPMTLKDKLLHLIGWMDLCGAGG